MGLEFDFSDVDGFFEMGKAEVKSTMDDIGSRAVEKAVAEGTYRNRTGNLRRSNYYECDGETLEIGNRADYASDVEAKGYVVCTSAFLWADSQLKENFNDNYKRHH